MAYQKIQFQDQIAEPTNTYEMVTNEDSTVTLTQTGITVEGTPINATNMDHIEDGIYNNSVAIENLLEDKQDNIIAGTGINIDNNEVSLDIVAGNNIDINENTISFTPTSKEPELGEWIPSILPVSANWSEVAYGDGFFVAVSNNSQISVYSEDGVNWEEGNLPSAIEWSSITYGVDKFVAFSHNSDKAAYSLNGITWAEITLPEEGNWNKVAYGNGIFVAIGDDTKVASSIDGITWIKSELPISSTWNSLAFGDGKFMAISNSTTAMLVSEDGITWEQKTLPLEAEWTTITYGNGKFVVLAKNSAIALYSTNAGDTWEQVQIANDNWISSCYAEGKFIAIASGSNRIGYSTDGATWTYKVLPSATYWNSIVHGGDKLVIIAGGENAETASVNAAFIRESIFDKKVVTLPTSGTIKLADNTTYRINATGNLNFVLPVVYNNDVFHEIKIQLSMNSVVTINTGTLYFFDKQYPDLSQVGKYDIYYEYDGSNWVCGARSKGLAIVEYQE